MVLLKALVQSPWSHLCCCSATPVCCPMLPGQPVRGEMQRGTQHFFLVNTSPCVLGAGVMNFQLDSMLPMEAQGFQYQKATGGVDTRDGQQSTPQQYSAVINDHWILPQISN